MLGKYHHDRCKMLNSNPVLVARHFQYHTEYFLKDLRDGPLGKTKYHAIRVDFQVSGSSHRHYFYGYWMQ